MLFVVHVEVGVLELFWAYSLHVVLIEQGGDLFNLVRTIAVIQTKLEQKVRFKAEKLVLIRHGHGGRWWHGKGHRGLEVIMAEK